MQFSKKHKVNNNDKDFLENDLRVNSLLHQICTINVYKNSKSFLKMSSNLNRVLYLEDESFDIKHERTVIKPKDLK